MTGKSWGVAVTSCALLLTCIVSPGASARASAGDIPTSCNQTLSAAQPIGTGSCPGVRPGAIVVISRETGGYCTMDFLFRDTRGNEYVGTAGHCILDKGGTTVWRSKGPLAFDSRNRAIGRFVYAVHREGTAQDFALIRLDRGVDANPEMCHFGGPTGVNRERTDEDQLLHIYGNGQTVGRSAGQSTLPARSLYAFDMRRKDEVIAQGVVNVGDSGSPVITDEGEAVGLVVSFADEDPIGGIRITRITPALQEAQRALGTRFQLITI